MRALVVGIIVVGLGIALPARADTLRTTAVGFDHMVHDRNIVVNGGESIACTRCHVDRGGKAGFALGRPDHSTCFGACHGAAPTTPRPKQKIVVPPDRTKVCTTCHSEAALAQPFARKLPVAYPPFVIDRDFAVTVAHKSHNKVACASCHVDPSAPAATPRPPHARCAGCHDGNAGHGSAMTKCQTCHRPAVGAPLPTALAVAKLPLTSTFSHKTHAARSAAGKTCVTCHAAVPLTDDTELPRPTAKTCAVAGCHDGTAFSITTAACTKCHRDPPQRTFEIARPTMRFSHATHSSAKLPCAGCHRLAPNGQIVAGTHEACAKCHDDFGSSKPRICGACHNTTEPWRALTADRAPTDVSEFGATLDHNKHPGACIACHRLNTATRELRPVRGHADCTNPTCHAVSSGPAPRLDACESCHQANLASARERARLAVPWTVRGGFSHTAAHRRTKDGHDIACETCHDDLKSVTVLSLAAPTKKTCMPCHQEGGEAFKLTGTSCSRCHGGKR